MPDHDLITECLTAIEAELHRRVGTGPEHLQAYFTMLEYHLGWTDQGGGGKRVRPLLCLLTCAACGADWHRALPMAAAIELLHNFSLLHDDIQDNSPLRRGRPTVWTRWGVPQAINAGDAMFTLAHVAPHGLSEMGVNPSVMLEALYIFDQTCLRLTEGQHLDMAFERRERVTVAEYETMIEGKTGALISACSRTGALLAGADADRCQTFEQYGRALGLAFQVQDDWLGIWGDAALTGKSAESDLEKRKKSLPVVFGLEHSPAFARAYAQPHHPGDDIAEMARILDELGAQAYTLAEARRLTAEAMQHLEAANPQGEAGMAMRALTAQLLNRTH